MGKRWDSEWKYYRFTKDDETKIRFRPQYKKDWYEKEGYKVEELKTRNSVLSSKLNQIPKSIKEVWLDE